jgi:telomerase reverse transcriptase
MFDSLLIPLICTNFHVTESNVHGSRLFFFRHDVWKTIAEPAITSLKMTTFEEVKMARAQKILHSRALGFSQMRLLPKETGVRPIMNLKRRPLKKGSKTELGSSINSVLKRVYNMLTYETVGPIHCAHSSTDFKQVSNPNRLGSTVFSVGDLYNKLKVFKLGLSTASKPPLYFAKVDVKAAFDTIPQDAVLKLMACIPSQSEYRISKHVEIKSGERDQSGDYRSKPICKWEALARAPDDIQTFQENLKSDLAIGKKNTIFIENIANQFEDKEDLISLLKEHVTQNMVKIDKKFYRQKQGIPQGSVVSSLLCNYFYADLEASHLQFLSGGNSLLVRLIDDFLLITTDRVHAKRFLQVMHDGLPEYGVQVNSDKTLTNFEVTINGKQVHRLVGTREFPYCGSFIDTKTLDLSKDRERKKDMGECLHRCIERC